MFVIVNDNLHPWLAHLPRQFWSWQNKVFNACSLSLVGGEFKDRDKGWLASLCWLSWWTSNFFCCNFHFHKYRCQLIRWGLQNRHFLLSCSPWGRNSPRARRRPTWAGSCCWRRRPSPTRSPPSPWCSDCCRCSVHPCQRLELSCRILPNNLQPRWIWHFQRNMFCQMQTHLISNLLHSVLHHLGQV